jgi:hypothetical protein
MTAEGVPLLDAGGFPGPPGTTEPGTAASMDR